MELYGGVENGSVQGSVFDQAATALPGQPYSLTDSAMVDSVNVAEAEGVNVAIGVVGAYVASARPGINNKDVSLPDADSVDADFEGVVVRSQSIRTKGDGTVYVPKGAQASVMRRVRRGGRIWVRANEAANAGGDVYWIIQDTAGHGFPIGSFAAAAKGEAGADTVKLSNVKFASTATAAGQPLLIEMGA